MLLSPIYTEAYGPSALPIYIFKFSSQHQHVSYVHHQCISTCIYSLYIQTSDKSARAYTRGLRDDRYFDAYISQFYFFIFTFFRWIIFLSFSHIHFILIHYLDNNEFISLKKKKKTFIIIYFSVTEKCLK